MSLRKASRLALVAFAVTTAAPALAQSPQTSSFNWTGFYAGLNVGAHWSDTTLSNTGTDTGAGGLGSVLKAGGFPSSIDFKANGLTGGLQTGYNVQLGAFVVGAEADLHWLGKSSSYDATKSVPGFLPATTSASRSLDRLYTLRAKAGIAIVPQVFLYGTGGFAMADGTTTVRFAGPAWAPPMATATSTDLKTGWTAGLGVEVALTRQVSLKAEYLHYDLGTHAATASYTYGLRSSTITTRWKDDGDIAQVGINYRF